MMKTSAAYLIYMETKRALGTEKAPGSCPYCNGEVMATTIECTRKLCCLTLSVTTKREYTCSSCSKRLIAYLGDA
ncbi:hypothetical protein LUZ61_011688 [Rhynchospora tenuis]|uniref:Uncharacterized protein n=1 Tax=Rhynchospora tenuis TaxID=198213 RepID=A0AAD6F0T0_9POAL|nr:hypothetical protein LUZ61_011688 [Rhynchospora tenuis]